MAQMPKEVTEYLRKFGQKYGKLGGQTAAKEHDGGATLCPRQEGIPGSSQEANGCASGMGTRRQSPQEALIR
jgi:hypothetical protein